MPLKATVKMLSLIVLMPVLALMQSCSPVVPHGSYNVDTVRFVLSSPGSGAGDPAPGIWIDTNVKLSGLIGGTVKSNKPYGIGFDYTDSTLTFRDLEFASIKLTYDNGTEESNLKTLSLPLRINARKYESANSDGTGRSIRTTVRLLSGKLPGIITRDEPFTLKIEGRFTDDNGEVIPFAIDQHYDVEKESETRSAADLFKDC